MDYQKFYLVTHRDAYSLPRIDSTLESLAGLKLLTTLDLTSGYWQVKPDDKRKTMFSTTKVHFESNVTLFRLTNTPTTFQHLMECSLFGLSDIHCLVYLDDIIRGIGRRGSKGSDEPPFQPRIYFKNS